MGIYPAITPNPYLVALTSPTYFDPYPAAAASPTYPDPTRLYERRVVLATRFAIAQSTRPSDPQWGATMSPEEAAAYAARWKEGAHITLEDTGQVFTYTLTSRFSVFLDDEKYPVTDLYCEPNPVIGYISNGSFRGPFLYPITYEGFRIGQCLLRNRDFAVTIHIIDIPTAPYPETAQPTLAGTPRP